MTGYTHFPPKARQAFAYIVQIDLPGHPIKVGSSNTPRGRLASFLFSAPANFLMLGATINGVVREGALKQALVKTHIRGEWYYPNDEVEDLVRQWAERGEWFVPADSHQDVFDRLDVKSRVSALHSFGERATHKSNTYGWAGEAIAASAASDPFLGLHWDGFLPSLTAPNFRPTIVRAVAA